MYVFIAMALSGQILRQGRMITFIHYPASKRSICCEEGPA
jgi:hypothetical protein